VDANIEKKDAAKQSWKKKHNPRISGGDVWRNHLPRHAKFKTPVWAVDKQWLAKLSEGDRVVEKEYMTDWNADDEYEDEGHMDIAQ